MATLKRDRGEITLNGIPIQGDSIRRLSRKTHLQIPGKDKENINGRIISSSEGIKLINRELAHLIQLASPYLSFLAIGFNQKLFALAA